MCDAYAMPYAMQGAGLFIPLFLYSLYVCLQGMLSDLHVVSL